MSPCNLQEINSKWVNSSTVCGLCSGSFWSLLKWESEITKCVCAVDGVGGAFLVHLHGGPTKYLFGRSFSFFFLKKEKHGGSMCSGTYGGGRKGLGGRMAWLLLYSLQCHWILVWIERTVAILDSIIRGPWKWYWIFIPLVMKGI